MGTENLNFPPKIVFSYWRQLLSLSKDDFEKVIKNTPPVFKNLSGVT